MRMMNAERLSGCLSKTLDEPEEEIWDVSVEHWYPTIYFVESLFFVYIFILKLNICFFQALGRF